MAACLITIGGTPGVGAARLTYVLDGNNYSLVAYSGDPIYIDDTATDIKYVLVGDATVSSLCLTVTEVVNTCYLFSYTVDLSCYPNIYGDGNAQFQFDQLILGSETFTLENVNISPVSLTGGNLVSYINSTTPKVQVVSQTTTSSTDGSQFTNSFILQVSTADVPELRMNNILDGSKSYLKGVLQADCTIPSPAL